MIKYLIAFLLFSPFAVSAQTQGTNSSYIKNLGGYGVDSIFNIPVRDTISWNSRLGNLTIRPQDNVMYWKAQGGYWNKVASSSGTGGAIVWSDTINTIATKKNIIDSSASLRASINLREKLSNKITSLLGYTTTDTTYPTTGAVAEYIQNGVDPFLFYAFDRVIDSIDVYGTTTKFIKLYRHDLPALIDSFVDNNTTYIPGWGLLLSGTTFRVDTSKIHSAFHVDSMFNSTIYTGVSPILVNPGTHVISHAASGVTPGTYTKVVVDALGHTTLGSALSPGDIPNINQNQVNGLPDTILNLRTAININKQAIIDTAAQIRVPLSYAYQRTVDSFRITGDTTKYITIYRHGAGSLVDSFIDNNTVFDSTGLYTAILDRVKYTDTANMLIPYLRKADTLSLSDRINLKANDNSVVHLFNPESIGGVKTFNQSPIVPMPTTLMQAVPKLYVDGAISDLSSVYIPLSQKGVPNGVAPLDAGGKVDFAYLPATLMIYKGVWSAASNTPTLTDGVGTSGWVYKANDNGIVNFGSHTDTIYSGDWVIYNGTIWQRTNNSDLVTSVNGQQGIVSLTTDHIPEGLSNLYYTNTRARNSVSASGDINYNPATGVFSYTTPSGLPPTGSAGGDLSGTYPNPSVVDDSHNHTIATLPDIQDSLEDRIPMTSYNQLNQNFANFDLTATSNRDHDFSNFNLNIFATKWTIEGATDGLHLASFTSNGLIFNGSATSGQPAKVHTDSITGSPKDFQFPDASGTLALRSDIPSLAGYWQHSDTVSTLATRYWVNNTFIPLTSYNTLNENWGNTDFSATGNRIQSHGTNSLSITGSNWSIDANTSVLGLTSTSSLGIGIKASSTTSGTALLKTDSIASGTRTFQFGPTSGRLAITADIPTASNYIVNSTSLQASSNFYISGSGRMNNAGIGVAPSTSSSLIVGKNIIGAASSFGVRQDGEVQSSVSNAYGFYNLTTVAPGFALGDYNHYVASQGTIGAGSTISRQLGFRAASNLIGANTTYGFYGEIPSGTNRWNVYMSGTAPNYFAANVGLGVTTPATALHLSASSVLRLAGVTSALLKTNASGDVGAALAGTDYLVTELDPKYTADTSKIMMYRWGLTTGNDLNTITSTGYYSANNTISATLVNAPQLGSPLLLEVWRNTSSGIYIMQRATYNGAISYRRFSIDGGANWGGWTPFGSVSNFSAGDLSPLFTTTEATTTTTPALSFSLSNAGANTFFGNNTGSTAAPSYTAMGALTKTDDANVTLTLGGTPATSLLKAVSMTLGWNGQLSVARGGTGAATLTGYVKGNGTSAFTASATIPYSDISGTPSLAGYELLANKATSLASPDNTKYPTTLAVSTDLATKEPVITPGTTGQFWRGDKTWQPIDWITGNQSITWTGTGDVTGSASGATSISPALTIANNAVTNAKAADMATQTFKGRTTAGTGDPEDLTIAQAKTMLNLTGTNSGDQTITLTGDVTGSGTGSFATAIGAGVIVNADINSSAAIAHSKMAALTANRAMVTDGSGVASSATTTATEIGYVNGVTSSIQTQLNGKVDWGTNGSTTMMNGYPANSVLFNSGSQTDAPYAGQSFTWNTALDNIYSAQMLVGISSGTGVNPDQFWFRTNQRGGPGWPGPWLQVASRDWVNANFSAPNNGTLTLATAGILTGSASFTANQSGNSTFTVTSPGYGTTAGTIAQGNDSRFHNAVTIGTANGLSLSTQALSLALANTSTTGALSSTDWNTFNSKAPGSGSANYIQNTTTPQTANFSIVGNGEIDGDLTVTGGVTSLDVLGVGNNSPSEALDVTGNAKISGNIQQVVTSSPIAADATGKLVAGTAYSSGSYTPTISGSGTFTPSGFRYIRVGNVVMVDGRIICSSLGGLTVTVSATLPIVTNVTAAEDVTGNLSGVGIGASPNNIVGDTSADSALVTFAATGSSASVYVHFSYVIQ